MNVFSMLRQSAAAAMVASIAAGFTLGATDAGAATIGFNYADGSETIVTLGGSGPATLAFSLDFGALAGQSVGGDFSLDVLNKDGTTISQVSLLGFSFDQAGVLSLGDTTLPDNSPVLEFSFANLTTWLVNLTADDLAPVTLSIKSTLTADFVGFNPVLSLDITGDAFVDDGNAQVTPIPGALPLFASGLGALGLLYGRRRKAGVAQQA